MTDKMFDYDKLDVYRLAIEYAAASFGIAKELAGLHRHARDQWLRAAEDEVETDCGDADPIISSGGNRFGIVGVLRHR